MSDALHILDGDINHAEEIAEQIDEFAPDCAALITSIITFAHTVIEASENGLGAQVGYLNRDQFASFLALLSYAAGGVAVVLVESAVDDWPVDLELVDETRDGLQGAMQALDEIARSLAGESGKKKRWWR